MKNILMSIILLMAVQLCVGQEGEEIYEILEGYAEGGEYDLSSLMEEMQDSLFELDFKEDSVNRYRGYRSPVRINFITSYWQNLEKADGYIGADNGKGFFGPTYGIRSRVQAIGRNFQIKTIAESDQGESDFRIPDHRSAGIAITPKREKFSLYFGDYHVEAGLGLGFASRPVFSSWKGEPHLIEKQRNRIGLHGGSDENRFLRGAAAEVRLANLTGKVFISGKNLDASMKQREGGLEYFSGVYSSGLHRTKSEIEKKDAVYEEIQGFIVEYSGGRFELGGLLTNIQFSQDYLLPIKDTWPKSVAEYSNSGTRYSLWGRSLLGEGMLMGEIALTGSLASAYKISYSRFDKNGITYILSYRKTSKGFFSHNTVASSSIITNKDESEGRINLLFRPRRKLGIQTDIRIKGVDNPAIGVSGAIFKIRGLIYYELENLRAENTIQAESGKIRNSIRIKPKDLEKPIYWQSEIGISSDQISNLFSDPGTFISLRARYRTPKKAFTLQTGLSLFTAGEGSVPFYTYEPDVLYGMSLPALSGTGARSFFLLKYTPIKALSIEFKVYRLMYADRDEIGTSYDRIPVGHRTGFKVQILFRTAH